MNKRKKGNIIITIIKAIVIIPVSLFLLFMAYIVVGHYLEKWTDKEKQQFALECSQTETLHHLGISFTGFSIDEIERVLIKRIHEGQLVDSFYISPHKESYDTIRNRYYASIDTLIHLKDTYYVIVPQSQNFILTDMKMVMSPRFTMFSENYGCAMEEYKIDGIKYETSSHPDFVKQGFTYPWEESASDSSRMDKEEEYID